MIYKTIYFDTSKYHMIKLKYGDFMLSKFEYSKNFIENDEILICPICKKELYLKEHSLMCENAHNFNLSKKGITNLFHIVILKKAKYIIMIYFSIEDVSFKKCFIKNYMIKLSAL